MMENGFQSTRAEAFPAGLRVLVVDDDVTWLKVLEKMLKKCAYEVTTCCLAIDALNILRERKDGFDIVISDVNMPDMDGFKLLELVGLEMDLPVIMMSVDGETSRVMKGVQHGACDYLLKPVRMKELKNIWQHVFRKKIHEVKDIESYEVIDDIHLMRNGFERFEDSHLLSGGNLSLAKKRKDMESKEHENLDLCDLSSVKKARVVWTVDLHQKFVNAVNQIGIDKVGPKKILDLMNIPWLTRENVASHLQKYRLYLSRLEKESEPNAAFGCFNQTDFSPKDPSTGFGLQSSITAHQSREACSSFGFSSGETIVQAIDTEIKEGDLKDIVPLLPSPEARNALVGKLHEIQKKSNGSQIDFSSSVGGSVGLDVRCDSFDSTGLRKHQWSREFSDMQFKRQTEPENKSYRHASPAFVSPHPCIETNSSINAGAPIAKMEKENSSGSGIKPLCSRYPTSNVAYLPAMASTESPLPLQPEAGIGNILLSGRACAMNESSRTKGNSFGHSRGICWGYDQKDLFEANTAVLQSSYENLPLSSLQDYDCVENTVLNNIEFLEYDDLELFAALPVQHCDRLKFNGDYNLSEPVEYPAMDQGLFIV
ncbi:hypothetical protein Scep_021082 [Stephania cephalantha]|uniref:Response regulatory domain-containing protein n=1 Tax=Stephania cephalantha TaxID=152367 RepID=A0AAP0F7W7_9MAGN